MKIAVFAEVPVYYDRKSRYYTINYTGLLDWLMALSKYVERLDIYLPASQGVGKKKLLCPKNVGIYTYGDIYLSKLKLDFISKLSLIILPFKKSKFSDYDLLFFTPPLAPFSILFKIFANNNIAYIVRGDFLKTSILSKSNYKKLYLKILYVLKHMYNILSYFIIKKIVNKRLALCITIGRYILKNNFRDENENTVLHIEPMVSNDIIINSKCKNKKKLTSYEFPILYVGRLSSEKGIEELIMAIALYKSSNLSEKKKLNLKLEIVGSGPLEDRLKKLVKKHNLENEISFIGFVPNDKITKYYDSAYIFINPAHTGSGRTVYEALARGLAVITTPSGIDEILCPNKNCILINAVSPERLLNSIVYLASNKILLKKISVNGIRTAKKVTFENQCYKLFNYILNHLKKKNY